MGFSLKKFAAGAGLGGGLGGLVGGFWGDLNKRKSAPGYQPQKPITASDISLLSELKAPISAINKKRQSSLTSRVGGVSDEARASMAGRGVAQSDYIPQEIGRASAMESRGIEDALLGALGGASYDEAKKQREHEQNLALAEEIGALSAPTLLQEILGGLGGGAKTGFQFSQLYDALNKNKPGMEYAGYSGPRPSYTSKLDLLRGGY